MTSSLKIRDVESLKHKTLKYITQNLYFSNIDDNKNKVLIYIRRKLYIVDDLRVKMLIENDIVELKNIVIDVVSKKARINSYKIEIKIVARFREEFVKRKI